VQALAPLADVIVCTRADSPRAATPEAIAAAVPDAAADVVCLPTVAEALGHARSVAQGADVVCVTGSFHVVGEAMQALGVQPWEDAED